MQSIQDIINELENSHSFSQTESIINQIDKDMIMTQEDMKRLLDVAAFNLQIYGTLNYHHHPVVRNFYINILKLYQGKIDKNVYKIIVLTSMISTRDIYQFLKRQRQRLSYAKIYKETQWHDDEYNMDFTLCDGLYHANSVSTSMSFIKHKKMYSRQYGDDHFASDQTPQWSDESDVVNGVYRDLFFDNSDICLVSGNNSAYGPITFVINDNILNTTSLNVRITKANPGVENEWGNVSYDNKYFTSIQELSEYAHNLQYSFMTRFNHHTTIYNRNFIALDQKTVKFILVARHTDLSVSQNIKQRLEEKLKTVGLESIPVIIRPTVYNDHVQFSTDKETLWKVDEDDDINNLRAPF